jgi:hypothetical protein
MVTTPPVPTRPRVARIWSRTRTPSVPLARRIASTRIISPS